MVQETEEDGKQREEKVAKGEGIEHSENPNGKWSCLPLLFLCLKILNSD